MTPSQPILFSVVIPNWNGLKFLDTCLSSLQAQTHPSLEIIVADNASADGSQAFIRENYPEVQLIELPENRGFTGACNAGLEAAQGDIVALLNNDTEVHHQWAEAIISAFARHEGVGLVASKMLLYDRRDHIHTAGDGFTQDGRAYNRGVWERDEGQYEEETFVFGACGGSAAYRRAMLEEVGVLDDDFFFLLEDMDLAWRAQLAGWRALYTPYAIVYHHLSATGGGVTASYYDGRNSIGLLIKDFPGPLWRKYGWMIARRQLSIAWDAIRAWRGAAARARLRGILAGIRQLPRWLRKRHAIQQGRKVTIDYLDQLLSPPRD